MGVTVELPGLRVISEANARNHWTKLAKRKQQQQAIVWLRLSEVADPLRDRLRAAKRVNLRLVRLGKRKLDRDNLAGAFKAVLDAVCHWLRIDDGNEERLGIEWAQEVCGEYGVRIEITEG